MSWSLNSQEHLPVVQVHELHGLEALQQPKHVPAVLSGVPPLHGEVLL